MINHKYVWMYGTFGNDYTPTIKEIHKDKMNNLFGFINNIVLESGQVNPIFNCGASAENILKECFYINKKSLDCIVYVPSYEPNIITFGDVQLTIVNDYDIPILFYSKIPFDTKKEKCSLLVKRLEESIDSENFSLALIDVQNIIDVIKENKDD